MSKGARKKSRRKRKAATQQMPQIQQQSPKIKSSLWSALVSYFPHFRKRFLLIWALLSTFANLVWAYIELQPVVTLSYVAENKTADENLIPIRITNSGLFEIEVFRIGGAGTVPMAKGQSCAAQMLGPFYGDKIAIQPNSSYDINFGYKGIPNSSKWGAALIMVEYKIPILKKTTGVQSVFVPQTTEAKGIGWISGTLRDFPLCDQDLSEMPLIGDK